MTPCLDFRKTVRHLTSRREVLGGLARMAVLGLSSAVLPGLLPRMAFGDVTGGGTGSRDVLVCIFLRGGADGLSFVAPYGEGAAYYDNRPTLGIPAPGASATAGLDLDGFFALHPSLAGFHQLYQAGSLAVVEATGGVDPTRSHFDAQRYMEQATPGDKSIGSGWIARHLANLAVQNGSPLRAIGFGGFIPTSLRGVTGVTPIAIDYLADFGLNSGDEADAAAMQAALATMYGSAHPTPANLLGLQAGLCFDAIDTLGQLNLDTYEPANGAVYPENSYIATALKQTALVIKQGLGLEVACMDIGSWDTHETAGTNDGYLRDQLKEFGDSIAAFVQDLGTAGMQKVTVITMSEFGRRVEENASQGTDHGHGNVMFAIGGSVNGGQVYGQWPGLSEDALDDGDLRITTDQRTVLWELLSKRLGNTAFTQTFPNFNQGTPPPTLNIFQ